MKLSKVILYDEATVPEIQISKLQASITDMFSIEVEWKKSFFSNADEKIFEKISSARVFDLKNQFKKHFPSEKDIRIESESRDASNDKEMILYDGHEMQRVLAEFVPTSEKTDNILHIVFTNRITCTFDHDDYRYHARALIASNPTIISTTGMIEAPAKSKQYYLDLMTCFSEDEVKEINEKYKGQFLRHHDSRLHEIAEGYLIQAIMYYETGDAFCKDKECRLFNAHWQKDLLQCQIEKRRFCKKHSKIISEICN